MCANPRAERERAVLCGRACARAFFMCLASGESQLHARPRRSPPRPREYVVPSLTASRHRSLPPSCARVPRRTPRGCAGRLRRAHDFATSSFAEAESGSWWEWYAPWAAEAAASEAVLQVWYEDMVEDLEREVRRLAAFVGIEGLSDETISRIVTAARFENMKKQFERVDAAKRSRGEPIKKNHIRRGGVGGWREVDAVAARRDEFVRRSEALPETFWCEAARAELRAAEL